MAKSANKTSKSAKVEATSEEGSKVVALHVSSGALQVDVGPQVIAMMAQADTDEGRIRELTKNVNYYRGEAVGRLVLGLVNAAKADPENVRPEGIYSDKKAERKAALDTAKIALGIMEVVDGELRYTEAVRKYFPPSRATKAYKESDKGKKTRAFESNVTTAFRKGLEATCGIVENGMDAEFDDENHALRLTNAPRQLAGPSGSVTLTGEQVDGAQERASIDALRRLSAKSHGKESAQKGKVTNGESLKQRALESEDAFGEQVNAIIGTIRALEGNATDVQQKHIESLYLVCGDFLGIK